MTGQPGTPTPIAFPYCQYHHEHKGKIERNELDISREKTERVGEDDKIWKEINIMKKWVIAGSGSMILALIVVVVQFIISFNTTAGAAEKKQTVFIVTEDHMEELRAMKSQ